MSDNPAAQGDSAAVARVHCVTCGREEATIAGRVPFPEPLRGEILANVGAPCWQEWLATQLKIINEYRLNLAEERSRELLAKAARETLKLGEGGGVDLVTGPAKARELGNLPEGE
jgi:Fe-S cluster biosynthesis and repair protein YggX